MNKNKQILTNKAKTKIRNTLNFLNKYFKEILSEIFNHFHKIQIKSQILMKKIKRVETQE
jgi:hypothetical protein